MTKNPSLGFLKIRLDNWRRYALCPVNWLCAHPPLEIFENFLNENHKAIIGVWRRVLLTLDENVKKINGNWSKIQRNAQFQCRNLGTILQRYIPHYRFNEFSEVKIPPFEEGKNCRGNSSFKTAIAFAVFPPILWMHLIVKVKRSSLSSFIFFFCKARQTQERIQTYIFFILNLLNLNNIFYKK